MTTPPNIDAIAEKWAKTLLTGPQDSATFRETVIASAIAEATAELQGGV